MAKNNKDFAVLTGDLVKSSRLSAPELKQAMQTLRDAAKRFQAAFPDSILGELDVYSGDGWQMLMPDWRRSLRAAVFLRATIKGEKNLKLDSRVAIAWGKVDQSSINPSRISESTGEAFTESGRALAGMDSGAHMSLHAKANMGIADTGILSASVALLDNIVHRWKPAQARAVSLSLLGHTQEQVAANLGVSQPTVHQAIQGCGWHGISDLLTTVENICK